MDKNRLRDAARNNIVTIMFIVLCAVCMAFSAYAPNYVLYELFGRLSRNMFIDASLIIPIVAGMGINFAITIGAMAAQIACLLVLEWGVPGIGGLALAALLTVPLGGIFGFLIGKLLNRMKGQEMIGSMILGYFANGLYQLLFLFIFDNIIPIHNPNLTIKGSTGIANTMDLPRGRLRLFAGEALAASASQAALVFAAVAAVLLVTGYLVSHRRNAKKLAVQLGVIAAAAAVMQLPAMKALFSMVSVPMATFGVVALLCLFNVVIMRTRLGQQLRAVGQSGVVANAAGIDVDRVRIIAIVFSTILAGWGQLIFVQNMGSLPDLRRARAGRPVRGRGDSGRRRFRDPRDQYAGARRLRAVPPDVHSRPGGRQEPLRRRGHRRVFPRVHLLRRDCAGAGHACVERE